MSGPKVKEELQKKYDIKPARAKQILTTAYAQIVDYNERMADKIAAVQLARVEEILQECMETNDRERALKAIDIINKMFCLYVERKDVNIHGDIIKFEFDTAVNVPPKPEDE
jgi:hypothetical protein